MYNLKNNDITQVSGGNSSYYYFDLLPGVEVVGFQQELIGYDVTEWTEKTGWLSSETYTIEVPVYAYYPIYSTTYVD